MLMNMVELRMNSGIVNEVHADVLEYVITGLVGVGVKSQFGESRK